MAERDGIGLNAFLPVKREKRVLRGRFWKKELCRLRKAQQKIKRFRGHILAVLEE